MLSRSLAAAPRAAGAMRAQWRYQADGPAPEWQRLLEQRQKNDALAREAAQEARSTRNDFIREANEELERELRRYRGATREEKIAALRAHRKKWETLEELKATFLLKAYKAKRLIIWMFLTMYISYFVHSCSFMRAMDKNVGAY